MKYIDLLWRDAAPEDPYRLVSEIDAQGYEVRKLEFFQSGAVGSASDLHETSATRLGTMAVPPLTEICTDPQFSGWEISAEQFESMWGQYGRPLQPLEAVQLIASTDDVPGALVGSSAAVLLVHTGDAPPAYEIEFVASDGTGVWQGVVRREVLRALQLGA